jgi:hypothetical protein
MDDVCRHTSLLGVVRSPLASVRDADVKLRTWRSRGTAARRAAVLCFELVKHTSRQANISHTSLSETRLGTSPAARLFAVMRVA